MTVTYTIDTHRHRFGAWAASRAASVKGCRFSVHQGRMLLEKANINQFIANPKTLPSAETLDETHKIWRVAIVDIAKTEMGLPFTHGVAAKLINVYVKAIFVCGGHHELENVMNMHPPIDSLLLNELAEKDVGGLRSHWKAAAHIRWSKLNSDQYDDLIKNIRFALGDLPLWAIEEYWVGYQ